MEKYRIKESIYILEEEEDIYSIIFTSSRKVKKFKVDGLVKEVINFLKFPRTKGEILNNLQEHSKKEIDFCLDSLESNSILRRYEDNFIENKYQKQILFIDELTNSWDETLSIHNRIKNSKIAVFGTGGIGTWIVNGLCQIGVGEIKIIDDDKVHKTNLNRQLYFQEEDIGKYKVDVLKKKLKDYNIMPYRERLSPKTNLEKLIGGINFIINCADSPSVSETTEILDKYASKNKISYCVAGGYNMHLGMVGPIIVPEKTKTFQDFLKFQKKNDPLANSKIIKDIENPGNLGPIAGAIANMQVMEIFKHLSGKGNINYNKFSEIDFLNSSLFWRNF